MAWLISVCWWILVALATTVKFIVTHLELDVIVLGSTAIILGLYIIYHAADQGGWWLFLHGTEQPSWRSCHQCSGMGVLMIDGTLIPLEFRTYYKDDEGGFVQKTAIANTKSCEYCLGHGGRWVYSNGELRRNIPTRRFGEKWDHD